MTYVIISNKASFTTVFSKRAMYTHTYMPKEFQMVDVIKPKTKLTRIKDYAILKAPVQLELGHKQARRRTWYMNRRVS